MVYAQQLMLSLTYCTSVVGMFTIFTCFPSEFGLSLVSMRKTFFDTAVVHFTLMLMVLFVIMMMAWMMLDREKILLAALQTGWRALVLSEEHDIEDISDVPVANDGDMFGYVADFGAFCCLFFLLHLPDKPPDCSLLGCLLQSSKEGLGVIFPAPHHHCKELHTVATSNCSVFSAEAAKMAAGGNCRCWRGYCCSDAVPCPQRLHHPALAEMAHIFGEHVCLCVDGVCAQSCSIRVCQRKEHLVFRGT